MLKNAQTGTLSISALKPSSAFLKTRFSRRHELRPWMMLLKSTKASGPTRTRDPILSMCRKTVLPCLGSKCLLPMKTKTTLPTIQVTDPPLQDGYWRKTRKRHQGWCLMSSQNLASFRLDSIRATWSILKPSRTHYLYTRQSPMMYNKCTWRTSASLVRK